MDTAWLVWCIFTERKVISNGPFISALLSFELLQHLEFVKSCSAFEFRVICGGVFPPRGKHYFFSPFIMWNIISKVTGDGLGTIFHLIFVKGKKKFEHVFYQLPTITEVALQTCQDVKCLQLWSHFWIHHLTIRRGSNIKSYEIVFMVASYSNQNVCLRDI